MDPTTSTPTNGYEAETLHLYADEEFDFPRFQISPHFAFPPVKSKFADLNSYVRAPEEPVARLNWQANISRNAAERYQKFQIQGDGLQLVNESKSKRVVEVNTVVDRLTYEEQFGKQKPEQKEKEINLKENKIALPQSTASFTFKRKLGKLSSLSEPPVSPLKKQLNSKTSSRTCTLQRESVTLSAARRKEILSLNKNSILEAASNVMESKVAQTLHTLNNGPERTTHRENNGPHSNGILYRGRKTSMRALRPKLAPSERVRLLRKKRTVKNEEVMALVPVMPLVPVSVVPTVRPTGLNKNGEPYRRILPKPSVVPSIEHDGRAKDEASGHSDPVIDQMISDRLNAMPFIIQSVPSSVIMVGRNGATSDGKKSTRKRKNNPSTESRTHQWRLNEAEEGKEKDCEKGNEEESDCEDIESSDDDEEEDDVIEIKEELEDDDEEYACIILQEEEDQVMKEEKETEDEEQKVKVMVKKEELDEEEDQGWGSLDNESNVKQENGYCSLGLEGQTYDQPGESNLGPQEPEIQTILGIRIKEEPEETYTW